jgi:hypothetical protein
MEGRAGDAARVAATDIANTTRAKRPTIEHLALTL